MFVLVLFVFLNFHFGSTFYLTCSRSHEVLTVDCVDNNLKNNCHFEATFPLIEIRFELKCPLSEISLRESDLFSNDDLMNISGFNADSLRSDFFPVKSIFRELIAHHNRFRNLSEGIFSGTELFHLDLSYNQFAGIEFLERAGAHRLKILNLSNNQIAHIADDAFTNLRILEHLNLACNNLSHMSFGSISALTKLISLNISQNHIKVIDMEPYSTVLLNLQRIDISSNGMNEINGFDALTFPLLSFLDLRNNSFNCTSLKSVLDSFGYSQELNLPSEPILDTNAEQAYHGISCKSFPLDQGRADYQCTSTNSINIIVTCGKTFERQNPFGYYHEYFSDCESYHRPIYVEIEFQNCSMSDLPTEALNQIGVQIIGTMNVSNLDGKALNSSYFAALKFLRALIAKHNELQHLEEKMFVNTALSYLDVAFNEFTEIESIGRSGASGLKTLKISNNKIQKLNVTSFKGLDHLEALDLSFNNLTTIGDETFDVLAELKNLSLAHTHLIHIDFGLLTHLENLQSLDISQTTIGKVDIGIHSGLFTNLQKINMSASDITEIDGLTQSIFPNLIYIDLRGNRINCSHLESILSSFDSHKLRLKPDPSSKIKKGESYRGIACEPTDSNRGLILNEQTHNSSEAYSPQSTPNGDTGVAMHTVIKALENHSQSLQKTNNHVLIAVLMAIVIVILSLFGFMLNKMQKRLKKAPFIVQVKRNSSNGDEFEVIQSLI